MTWSIVALGPENQLGIAIASRFFAVGALCPYIRSGVGAVATQALVNPHFGPLALEALASGQATGQVVAALIAADAGSSHRQLHLIDAAGRVAAHTGAACIDWCGHVSGAGWSVAGNMLAGPQVLDETARAFMAEPDLPFALRLVRAMQAGEAAGGDKRGRQGAALLVHAGEAYPALDLRVDDHEDPLAELQRLYDKSLERFQPFVTCLPSRSRPAGITDRTEIEARIAHFHAARTAPDA